MSEITGKSRANFKPRVAGNGILDGISDYINNSCNVGKESGQIIASIGMGAIGDSMKAKGRAVAGKMAGVAGELVTPAVWVLSGKQPQPGDVAFWLAGAAAGQIAGAIPGAIVGMLKAVTEDHEDAAIANAVRREPAMYRPFIKSVRDYGAAQRAIVAETIASHGGVAWRVDKSVWVYIADAKGRLVCDYEPFYSLATNGPVLPLQITSRGGGHILYKLTRKPGTHIG